MKNSKKWVRQVFVFCCIVFASHLYGKTKIIVHLDPNRCVNCNAAVGILKEVNDSVDVCFYIAGYSPEQTKKFVLRALNFRREFKVDSILLEDSNTVALGPHKVALCKNGLFVKIVSVEKVSDIFTTTRVKEMESTKLDIDISQRAQLSSSIYNSALVINDPTFNAVFVLKDRNVFEYTVKGINIKEIYEEVYGDTNNYHEIRLLEKRLGTSAFLPLSFLWGVCEKDTVYVLASIAEFVSADVINRSLYRKPILLKFLALDYLGFLQFRNVPTAKYIVTKSFAIAENKIVIGVGNMDSENDNFSRRFIGSFELSQRDLVFNKMLPFSIPSIISISDFNQFGYFASNDQVLNLVSRPFFLNNNDGFSISYEFKNFKYENTKSNFIFNYKLLGYTISKNKVHSICWFGDHSYLYCTSINEDGQFEFEKLEILPELINQKLKKNIIVVKQDSFVILDNGYLLNYSIE